jgi:uncharacterized membrane protein SpoIIM required for sporulation
MRVADRLARREASWNELDELLDAMSDRRNRGDRSAQVLRLGELYRSACTDLMLAESHDLPRDTVDYLHALVGRAHNAVYRARGFRVDDWSEALFGTVPRQLRVDPALRIALLVFFGAFLLCALFAAGRPSFARQVLSEPFLEQMEQMYAEPIHDGRSGRADRNDSMMAGFYVMNNAGIGLQCFAWGLAFGLGSLYILASNAVILGTVFGYMATTGAAGNFFTFVTAHAPFELMAIVFSGAAGLRMGYGLIDTRGQTRWHSLRREARNSLPTVGAAVLLFVMAAFVEGFVSGSAMPYGGKAAIAVICAALLAAYVRLGGRRPAPRPV